MIRSFINYIFIVYLFDVSKLYIFFIILIKLRPCLVHPEIQKVFKIPCHIKSYGIYMNHYIYMKIKTNHTV